jgi:hypothetical protein
MSSTSKYFTSVVVPISDGRGQRLREDEIRHDLRVPDGLELTPGVQVNLRGGHPGAFGGVCELTSLTPDGKCKWRRVKKKSDPNLPRVKAQIVNGE